MDNWMSYLHELSRIEAEGWIGIALGLFDWFDARKRKRRSEATPAV